MPEERTSPGIVLTHWRPKMKDRFSYHWVCLLVRADLALEKLSLTHAARASASFCFDLDDRSTTPVRSEAGDEVVVPVVCEGFRCGTLWTIQVSLSLSSFDTVDLCLIRGIVGLTRIIPCRVHVLDTLVRQRVAGSVQSDALVEELLVALSLASVLLLHFPYHPHAERGYDQQCQQARQRHDPDFHRGSPSLRRGGPRHMPAAPAPRARGPRTGQ